MLKALKKFWKWLWTSNSVLSWFVSFLLAFILVRFIFYPLLGLVLSTSLPLVVIESNSMNHFGNFDEWFQAQEDFYGNFNIVKEEAEKWPFRSGLDKGDVALIRGKSFDDLEIGDVIIFRPPSQEKAVIHRIVVKTEDKVETKGDANIGQLGQEKNIAPEQVAGVAILRIPYIGWLKLMFVEILRDFR